MLLLLIKYTEGSIVSQIELDSLQSEGRKKSREWLLDMKKQTETGIMKAWSLLFSPKRQNKRQKIKGENRSKDKGKKRRKKARNEPSI